jgi:hypothetical protein
MFTDEQIEAIEQYEEEKSISIWLNRELEWGKERKGD